MPPTYSISRNELFEFKLSFTGREREREIQLNFHPRQIFVLYKYVQPNQQGNGILLNQKIKKNRKLQNSSLGESARIKSFLVK